MGLGRPFRWSIRVAVWVGWLVLVGADEDGIDEMVVGIWRRTARTVVTSCGEDSMAGKR